MKKLLALVLALVMTLSLCVVSSNAAYTDAADIDFDEAVEVMSAVGVFQGSDGKFDPKANLTREQAAKLVAYLDLGEKTAEALPAVKVFNDVAADRWSAKYVAYCANAGYINGVGGGNFDPAGSLTGYAFGKMLLCVLGYDADIEGMTGANWAINVAKLMDETSLNGNVDKAGSVTLAREEAAQYCLNALQADCVKYAGGTSVSTSDGTTVTVNANLVKKTNAATDDYRTVAADRDTIQQLAEKLYSKLKLTSNGNDDLKRPAHTWVFKGEEVSTYADSADKTEIVKKAGKTVLTFVQDVMKKNYTYATTPVVVNGGAAAANTTALMVGDKVEFFMNSNIATQVDKVVVTRYTAVNDVTGEVQTRTNSGVDQVLVPGVTGWTNKSNVVGYEGLAKGDCVVSYTASGTKYLTKTSAVEGKLTEIKGSGAAAKYVIEGTEYQCNEGVGYTAANFNDTYQYFLDDNGFVVKEKLVEAEKSEFVVLQEIGIVTGSGVGSSNYANARLVKTDGTVSIEKIASVKIGATTYKGSGTTADKLINTTGSPTIATAVNSAVQQKFFTYTVDTDGKYALTEVDFDSTSLVDVNTGFTGNVTKKATKLGTYVIDDNTVFVIAKDGTPGNDGNVKFVTFTGKNNVANVTAVTSGAVVTNKSNIAQFVFVGTYTGSVSTTSSLVFLKDTYDSMKTEKIDGSNVTYYVYKVINDTEFTTVKYISGAFTVGTAYDATYDSNGMVTGLTPAGVATMTGASYELSNGTLVFGANAVVCGNDVTVVVEDAAGDFTTTTASAYNYNSNVTSVAVTVVLTNGTDNTAKIIFVKETNV